MLEPVEYNLQPVISKLPEDPFKMLQLSKNQIIRDFRHYAWGAVWSKVKEQSDDLDLAIRAFFLAAWWEEPDAAKEILFRIKIREGIALVFICALAELALADVSAAQKSREILKRKNAPTWMLAWFGIEYLGRSRNFKLQARSVEQVLKSKGEADYVFVACLQSLDQAQANLSHLKRVLEKISCDSPLCDLLRVRVGLESSSWLVRKYERLPDAAAIYQAGLVYQAKFLISQGLTADGIRCLDQAAQIGLLDKSTISLWLGCCASHPAGFEDLPMRANYLIKVIPHTENCTGVVYTYLLIHSWLNGKYKEAYNIAKKCPNFGFNYDDKEKINKIYFRYILLLCLNWQNNTECYTSTNIQSDLFILGESHCLSPANLVLEWMGDLVKVHSRFVMGLKMYHLSSAAFNSYKSSVKAHLHTIDRNSHLLIHVGEIDCRPEEGLWHASNRGTDNLKGLIYRTVTGYVDFVSSCLNGRSFKSVTMAGIPAPGYPLTGKRDPGCNKAGFLKMIADVNNLLKETVISKGWGFLDVHAATSDEAGIGNGRWHLDGWHLQPDFYIHAREWLFSPGDLNKISSP